MNKKNKNTSFLVLPIGMCLGVTFGVVFKNIPVFLCGGLFIGLLADVIKNQGNKN